MKPTELKQEYIRLRAEGKSYSYIAGELHISKSTCTKWEKDLASQISDLKRAELTELYESYGMTKQARIKRIGETLDKINAALANADFSEIDPAKLLDFKLKYTEALKGEYIPQKPPLPVENISGKAILSELTDLLNRIRAGDMSEEQARKEAAVLASLLKAYDTVEVKEKLDKIEAILAGRE